MYPEFLAAMATATTTKRRKQRHEIQFKREDERKEELAAASVIWLCTCTYVLQRSYFQCSLPLICLIIADRNCCSTSHSAIIAN